MADFSTYPTGQLGAAGVAAAGQGAAAGTQYASQQAASEKALQQALGVAGIQSRSATDVANIGLQGQLAGYAAQQAVANTQAQAGIQQAGIAAGASRDVAGQQAQAAMYPATLQQQRFGQIFPMLSSAFGQVSGALSGGAGGGGGPATTANRPTITAAPVYTPAQQQAQANALRAGAFGQAEGQIKQTQQQLAGSGFGANSPLAQALAGGARGQALQSSQAAITQAQLAQAQANAQQVLAGQTAQEQQFASAQQEQIARAGIAAQQYSALIGALAGMS